MSRPGFELMRCSRAGRIIALLVVIAVLQSCVGLTPPSKYDTRDGLVVTGEGLGHSSLEAGTPAATREARMAAILQGLAAWTEAFSDLKKDVDRSEDEIPLELYNPENPPEDLSNLTVYRGDMEACRQQLSLGMQPTGRSATSEEGRRGFVATCSLRPGVNYRYEAEWDDFEVQIVDLAELGIDSSANYFQAMTLRAQQSTLTESGSDVIPVEYVEGLLGGHGIDLTLHDRPDGATRAVLTRRFDPR